MRKLAGPSLVERRDCYESCLFGQFDLERDLVLIL